jgi:alpha-L-rhamnosidase
VKAVLTIVDANGKRSGTQTSPQWSGVLDNTLITANIYGGEAYDARAEIPGWCTASFAPSSEWQAATTVTEFSTVTPSWQPMQPIRLLETNQAQTITQIRLVTTSSEMVYVYKFPQNAAAVTALTLRGCPAGTVLTVYPSENLCGVGPTRWSPPCSPGQPPGGGQNGTVDQRNYRTQENTKYTCKGEAAESWTPRFTYTG